MIHKPSNQGTTTGTNHDLEYQRGRVDGMAAGHKMSQAALAAVVRAIARNVPKSAYTYGRAIGLAQVDWARSKQHV